MVAKELENKVFKYINDINLDEISNNLAMNRLREWLEEQKLSIKRAIIQIERCYEEHSGWISLSEEKPGEGEIVQLLIYDDHYDYDDTYVMFGWRVNDIWISDNEIIDCKVVAWKPGEKPLSPKEVIDLGWTK